MLRLAIRGDGRGGDAAEPAVDGEEATLPDESVAMVGRIGLVETVKPPALNVWRQDGPAAAGEMKAYDVPDINPTTRIPEGV